MLAVSAGAVGVGTSLAHVVDSVSGDDRKPTPILLLPVDGRVATALQSDIEESWLSSTTAGKRRGSGRQSGTPRLVDEASYRHKRQRNNEAARRSREKRRQQDGVLRQQLDTLVAENRELRCQLALFRRLLDEVSATGALPSSYQHKDGGAGAGALQHGWSSLSSISSGDQSQRADVTDESSGDDLTTVERKSKRKDGEERVECSSWIDDSDADHWDQRQLPMPLNLSLQRVASS